MATIGSLINRGCKSCHCCGVNVSGWRFSRSRSVYRGCRWWGAAGARSVAIRLPRRRVVVLIAAQRRLHIRGSLRSAARLSGTACRQRPTTPSANGSHRTGRSSMSRRLTALPSTSGTGSALTASLISGQPSQSRRAHLCARRSGAAFRATHLLSLPLFLELSSLHP